MEKKSSSYKIVKLRFPCPGDTCSKKKILSWVHTNCKGEIYIDTEAYMWCEKH